VVVVDVVVGVVVVDVVVGVVVLGAVAYCYQVILFRLLIMLICSNY